MGFNPAGERGRGGLIPPGHDLVPSTPGTTATNAPTTMSASSAAPGTERSPGSAARISPLALEGRADDGDAIMSASTTVQRGTVSSLSEAGYGPCHDHGGLPGRPVSHQGR